MEPAITLNKTVDPPTMAEPGGVFAYTLTVHNGSVEAVKLTKVTDSAWHAL